MKGNIKLIIGIIIGASISGFITYAATQIEANQVYYNNKTLNNSLDQLYFLATGNNEAGAYIYSEKLIPNMTSLTQPSGTITASSTHTGRPAYQAFSGKALNLSDGSTFWYTSNTNNEYIQYTWDEAILIHEITYKHHVRMAEYIQYLNSNNEWVNIQYVPSSGNDERTNTVRITLDSMIKTTAIRWQFIEGSNGFLAEANIKGMAKLP